MTREQLILELNKLRHDVDRRLGALLAELHRAPLSDSHEGDNTRPGGAASNGGPPRDGR
jgi:hypothetical protein